jgi:hypothetical protein
MWRHGDVLMVPVDCIPSGAKKRSAAVLVRGELTGHSHRLADPEAAEIWEQDGVMFLKVVADSARVIHEEHRTIALPRGLYRVWQQREYSPQAIRRVMD